MTTQAILDALTVDRFIRSSGTNRR